MIIKIKVQIDNKEKYDESNIIKNINEIIKDEKIGKYNETGGGITKNLYDRDDIYRKNIGRIKIDYTL